MESNPPTYNQPVHIINIDIEDNHEQATMGAFLIGDLVTLVNFLLNILPPWIVSMFVQSYSRFNVADNDSEWN